MTVLVYLTKTAAARINRPSHGWYVAEAALAPEDARIVARTWRAKGFKTRIAEDRRVVIDGDGA